MDFVEPCTEDELNFNAYRNCTLMKESQMNCFPWLDTLVIYVRKIS